MSYKNHKNFIKLLGLFKSSKFLLAKELILKDEDEYKYDPIFYNLLGFIYEKLGDFQKSELNYIKSYTIDKNYYEPKFNLGVLKYKQKHLEIAKNIFLELINDDNQDFRYYFNLAIIFFDQEKYEDALKYLKVCCYINSKSYEAHHQLGLVYEKLKDFDNSIKYYKIADKLNSGNSLITLNNLGNIYLDLKDYKKAIQCFEKSLTLNGDKSPIYNNLGIAYNEIGDTRKTLYFWKEGLNLRKENLILRQRYLFHLLYTNDGIDSYKNEAKEFRSNIVNFKLNNNNFKNLSRAKDKKLKVGFVSADFKAHPVAYFLIDILPFLKNKDFILYAYSSLKEDEEDKYTGILKKEFDFFINSNALSDFELSKKIIEDKVDILVDMSGYTNKTRLQIFAQKISPLQITWAAWLATTGIKEIDYIIGDPFVTPENYSDYYVEKILQLPNIWCHLSTSDIKNLKTVSTPGLKNKFVTFGKIGRAHV